MTTAMQFFLIALVLVSSTAAFAHKPAVATLPPEFCPIGFSILVEQPKELLCRADANSDELIRKYPAQLLGVPLGAAGFVVGLIACPVALVADRISNPKGHSGDAGLASGLFTLFCPVLIAKPPYEFGKKAGAAPFIALKRLIWDCPKAAVSQRPRTGTIVNGKLVWDEQILGLSNDHIERVYRRGVMEGLPVYDHLDCRNE